MFYTPLYIKTEYSLLNSMIKVQDLVKFASKHNIKALTITDDNMCGVMEFYKACTSNNIKPIIGLNLKIFDKTFILYAKNITGYHNLLKLSTIISEKNLTIEDLQKYHSDLICIIPFESLELESKLTFYEHIYIGYKNKEEYDQLTCNNKIYLKETLYLNKEDYQYYKYIIGIKDNLVIDQLPQESQDNYLYLEESLNYDLKNNYEIYNLCNVELEFNKSLIPKYPCPDNQTSFDYLKYLCKEGLKRIFGDKVNIKYIERLKYELSVINEMNFCDYFLIVWDYVNYAKKNGILVGPGRGSSAGSLVSYCLNIIEIDPLKYDLLFERFLNKDRVTMPDIDIDFDGIRREEVINYCKEKYGIKNVSNIITFSSLTSKQVLKDVGKVLDLPLELVDYFAKMFRAKVSLQDNYNSSDRIKNHLEKNPELRELFDIALKLENLKKHISSHASGIVICSKQIDEVIPLVSYNDEYLTGFTMEYLEELGLIKMDFLALKTLTTIDSMLKDIGTVDFNNIPLDDKETLKIFYDANTVGIFQFESGGMINFLRKFKPVSFEEIYHIIALYRPGPMGNIDTFIRRRNNQEKVDYFDPSLEPILKSTYGIIIYQEQIMQLAVIMANYTLGEADILRRAMSKKKEAILLKEKDRFISRSIENGYTDVLAKQIYSLILKFAEYGFPKAHAVAYSVISYKMAYLKAHYKIYFMKNMLNHAIGSEIDTKEYIIECKENNIKILKPDINKSMTHYEIEDNNLLFPFLGIRNVGLVATNHIILERSKGNFIDIFDFIKRVNRQIINRQVLENLIYSGCFDSFELTRKTLIENLDVILNYADLLTDLSEEFVIKPELTMYEEYSNKELISHEYKALGFYLNVHPVNEYRKKYNKLISINSISNYLNRNIDIIVRIESLREVRTKNQELICFTKISDELSFMEAPIFANAYKNIPEVGVGDIIKINGRVNRRNGKDQLIINALEIIEKAS